MQHLLHRIHMRVSAFSIATLAAAILLAPTASAQSSTQPLSSGNLTSSAIAPGILDELGRPQPHLLQQAKQIAPSLPDQLRAPLLAAIAFYEGSNGEGGVALPDQGPKFTQFYWPSIGTRCIGGTQDAMASAIAVPGPTEIPAPGAKAHESAFVFTALGTAPAAGTQNLRVHWVNLNTLTIGSTPLSFHGINPDGPATLSGTAATGAGTIAAVIEGGIHTTDGSCNFVPTAALFEVS